MIYSQTRHLMQGAGTVNMSMGGASTAQPLDIRRALQWNPGSISVFDSKMAQ
jgi:long-chain fatty acid transport protein